MKKEEFVSGVVMLIVCVMVMVGVTIAWFSSTGSVFGGGMWVKAAEAGSVIIALEPGGEDIGVLAEDDIHGNEYADMGLFELTNIESGKLAPGASGKVTFYVTPKAGVVNCGILPLVRIRQGEDIWYPDVEGKTEGSDVIQALCEKVGRHISFYSDKAMTIPVNEENPYLIEWADNEAGIEKTAVLYWVWHYEYPFTQEEQNTLTAEEKKALIEQYDEEDTDIGKNISEMKFHFTFSVR